MPRRGGVDPMPVRARSTLADFGGVVHTSAGAPVAEAVHAVDAANRYSHAPHLHRQPALVQQKDIVHHHLHNASRPSSSRISGILGSFGSPGSSIGSVGSGDWKIASSDTGLASASSSSDLGAHPRGLRSEASVIDIPDLSALNLRPADRGEGLVKCDLERVKRGVLHGGETTSFLMYVAGTDELILSAKKKGNEWFLSSYTANQSDQNHCAVLSWNSWRSEFTLHGRWCSACEPGATPFTCCTPHHERETLAAIVYEKNYKGDCPRKFTAVVPSINQRGERVVFCPNQERRRDIIACFDSGDWGHLIPFVTKPPKWNEATKRFEGGFTDRVKIASVKNFILQKAGRAEPWLQFGKFSKNRYALDFQYPLSPIQAFAIAISSFEASLMYT